MTEPVTSDEWAQIFASTNAFLSSMTMAVSAELGVFDVLSARPGLTQRELAEALELPAPSVRALLLSCCACRLTVREGEGYRNTALAEKFLVASAPFSIVPYVRYVWHMQVRGFRRLKESLREGTNRGLEEFPGAGDTLYQRIAADPETRQIFHDGMAAYSNIATTLLNDARVGEVKKLLDVGAGDGKNSVKLCREHPHLEVVILDLPHVCVQARQTVAEAGMTDRIRVVEGDMFESPWPEGCDGVLLSHIVEIFSEGPIRALYRKASDYLAGRGRLMVRTMCAADDETGGLQAAKSTLYFLALASGQGMCHPRAHHERWLRESGFSLVTCTDAPEIDQAFFVAMP